jgi:hypothetical protein
MTYWLSYGGGVNSTALAILMTQGLVSQYGPWRIVFADTGDEKPTTYAYIHDAFQPWLRLHGKELEIVRPKETVLARWERLKVTGSRLLRSCTVEGKIKPIQNHIAVNGGGESILGIDAGEAHRMPGKIRPLVDLDIDRDGCESIIRQAGLPVPEKSGCWHCPFARVGDVLKLIINEPCKADRIERLEQIATNTHGPCPDGSPRTQWRDKPVSYWKNRARHGGKIALQEQAVLFPETTPPCGCYDG